MLLKDNIRSVIVIEDLSIPKFICICEFYYANSRVLHVYSILCLIVLTLAKNILLYFME
jgi:hypothetical protein